ncbi:tetratricopeptide repeat protein [Hymenobacter sp. BRD67]|uniref:tetratricopeptide repeat-containing sensor histidine kinase n=1 Tax=Hymenobacter sp. BRD67 TaxID=2675877 RepID=UPI0015643596|nr:tetratricopeptide repeat protein [Hymenobacter sp. BRD67]QKG54988.1 tetratricopeptide repeat protein [Hymenobacter sp. BRD67]
MAGPGAGPPQPTLTRVTLLDRLTEALEITDQAASYAAHLEAWRLAFQLPYPEVRAEMLLGLADYHAELAHYDSAATYLPLAEHQFRLDHNLGGVVRCLLRLGRMADYQGRYAASLGYNQQALALATTGNTNRFRATAYLQLATTYTQVGELAEARRYLLAARQEAEQEYYPDRLNLALGGLGELARQQGHPAEARHFFIRALAVSERIADVPTALNMQLALARLLADQGQLPAAATAGRQLLAHLQAAHLLLLVPPAQALLAQVALRQGRVAEAVAYARQSLAGSRRAHLLRGVAEASAVLADAYARQGRYPPALLALHHYLAAHDSLLGEQARRRAAVLENSQQQREQRARIRLLTQQTRLQAQTQEVARLRSQRTVFGLGAVLLLTLLLAGGLFWQYRRRQAAARAIAAADLRQRLAADLHDDVGSLLTQVSLQSSILRELAPDASPLHGRLDALATTARYAAQQMTDVVLCLHEQLHTLPQLLARLRDHAHEVLAPAEVDVTFAVPATLPAPSLPPEVLHQLYLIYKEALHNVVKHAQATQVTVTLTVAAALTLHVTDDGRGYDGSARPGGQGLRNMQERARAVGGTVRYYPAAPSGRTVEVQLPL